MKYKKNTNTYINSELALVGYKSFTDSVRAI